LNTDNFDKHKKGAGPDDETLHDSQYPSSLSTKKIIVIEKSLEPKPKFREITDTGNKHPNQSFSIEERLKKQGTVNYKGFQITELIASGGFSDIYKAIKTHEVIEGLRLRQTVAIKILRKENENDKAILKQFCFGIAILTLLNECVNFQRIYKSNTKASLLQEDNPFGNYFIVTDYIKGKTLDKFIKSNAKKIDNPSYIQNDLNIFKQLLQAVAFLHDKNIIHRDLTPNNIMVSVKKNPKTKVFSTINVWILDFDICFKKGNQQSIDEAISKSSSNFSKDSNENQALIIGTPAYMSPEQAQGLELDKQTDIYTLGLVLYYLVTGYPFIESKENSIRIVKKIAFRNDEILDIPEISDPRLASIIQKATHLEPDQRYESAYDFLEDIKKIEANKNPTSHKGNYAKRLLFAIQTHKCFFFMFMLILLLLDLNLFQYFKENKKLTKLKHKTFATVKKLQKTNIKPEQKLRKIKKTNFKKQNNKTKISKKLRIELTAIAQRIELGAISRKDIMRLKQIIDKPQAHEKFYKAYFSLGLANFRKAQKLSKNNKNPANKYLDRSIAYFKKSYEVGIKKGITNSRACYFLGNIYSQWKEKQKSQIWYKKGFNTKDTVKTPYHVLCKFNYFLIQNRIKEAKQYANWLEIQGNSTWITNYCIGTVYLILAQNKARDTNKAKLYMFKAEKFLTKAVKNIIKSKSEAAFLYLATCKNRLRKYELTLGLTEILLLINPVSAKAIALKLHSLYKLRKFQKARSFIHQHRFKAKKANLNIFYISGTVFIKLKNYKKAIKNLKIALKIAKQANDRKTFKKIQYMIAKIPDQFK
jgi:serine/threonine protein kinase